MSAKGRWTLRGVILLVALLNIALFVRFALTTGPFPDTVGGDQFLNFLGLLLALITVPPVILALLNRWLWVALGIVLVPEVLMLKSWIESLI